MDVFCGCMWWENPLYILSTWVSQGCLGLLRTYISPHLTEARDLEPSLGRALVRYWWARCLLWSLLAHSQLLWPCRDILRTTVTTSLSLLTTSYFLSFSNVLSIWYSAHLQEWKWTGLCGMWSRIIVCWPQTRVWTKEDTGLIPHSHVLICPEKARLLLDLCSCRAQATALDLGCVSSASFCSL